MQLLRKMQLLLGGKVNFIDSSLLRELFMQCLPSKVQMILASADEMTIDKLAERANQIMEVGTPAIPASADPPKAEISKKITREEVAAALQTQERAHPRFSAMWKRR